MTWAISFTEITEGDAVRRRASQSIPVIGTRDILGLLTTVTRLLTELVLGTGTVLELERGAITASCRNMLWGLLYNAVLVSLLCTSSVLVLTT